MTNFTNEQLEAWAQNGGSMRSLVAMRLAACVIELDTDNALLRSENALLRAENARLRDGRDKLIKASEAVCENDAKHASDKALLWDLTTTIAALKGGEI